MIYSIRTKTSGCWFAPMVLMIVLMHSQTAQAIEPAGSSDIVVAPHLPADSSDRVAAPSERDPAILRDPQAEQALHGDGPVIKAFVKPRRAAFRTSRVRREEKRPRFGQRGDSLWHYYTRWGTSLILGVGF
jgi:hypothetical protein